MITFMRRLTATGLALVLGFAVAGCAAAEEPMATATAFDVTGAVVVPSGADERYVGTPCDGFRGVSDRKLEDSYDDIAAGSQVVVSDESGKKVGVTTLDEGLIDQLDDGKTMVCRSEFNLGDLPEHDLYSIQVGNSSRTDMTFTLEQMKSGPEIIHR